MDNRCKLTKYEVSYAIKCSYFDYCFWKYFSKIFVLDTLC